jgi:hypothetical protein
MKLFLTILSLILLSHSLATAGDSLRLYAPFEGSPVPDFSASKFHPTVIGELEYVDGVKGRAVVCNADKGYISFPIDQIFNAEVGTLSLWMKPLDWEDGDGKFHFLTAFLSSNDSNRQRFLLYKYHMDSSLTLLMDTENPKQANLIQKDPGDWSRDVWRHYVLTWTPDELTIYLDGEMFATVQRTIPFEEAEFESLLLGNGAFGLESGKSAFDELQVYDEALTPEEILALYDENKTALE